MQSTVPGATKNTNPIFKDITMPDTVISYSHFYSPK